MSSFGGVRDGTPTENEFGSSYRSQPNRNYTLEIVAEFRGQLGTLSSDRAFALLIAFTPDTGWRCGTVDVVDYTTVPVYPSVDESVNVWSAYFLRDLKTHSREAARRDVLLCRVDSTSSGDEWLL